MTSLARLPLAVAVAAALLSGTAVAESGGSPHKLPTVQVTTAKVDEPTDNATVGVTVLSGAELRARGAIDLRTALSGVAGVEAAPGGDGGPASSVPGFWGLKEFDAFLLLVDGTPWGGAFNPALATLDLNNIDRIEVIRGPAPVSYGATSFVGVIHVIHRAAGEGPRTAEVGIGSRGSWRVGAILPLVQGTRFAESLSFDGEKHRLDPDRSGYDRAHLLYRAAGEADSGKWTADLDFTHLNQDPASPHPREGRVLSTRVPLDANHNPHDAKYDENRAQLALSWTEQTGLGAWESRLSIAHSNIDNTRGFLRGDFSDGISSHNADGFRQDRSTTELYLDSHVTTPLWDRTKLVWGFDHQYGRGEQDSKNFEYGVALDGHGAPSSHSLPIDELTELKDRRNFSGLYAQLLADPTDRLHVDAGLRVNHTNEHRRGEEFVTEDGSSDGDSDHRSQTRLSGAVGASFRLWKDGGDELVTYANYRNTFKPAVVDFGPEAESEILKAEKATSGEFGLRGENFDGALEWDASLFYMDFKNLVVPTIIDGSPALENAGRQYFKGVDLEARYHIDRDWSVSGTWAYHQARFGNYERLFGDTLTQLRGRQQELAPNHLYGAGILFAPESGWFSHVDWNYIGRRFLNKRNTAPAGSYNTFDAGLGFNGGSWTARLDGYNLSDARDPVAESELGDGQYYRMMGREYWMNLKFDF